MLSTLDIVLDFVSSTIMMNVKTKEQVGAADNVGQYNKKRNWITLEWVDR